MTSEAFAAMPADMSGRAAGHYTTKRKTTGKLARRWLFMETAVSRYSHLIVLACANYQHDWLDVHRLAFPD